MQTDARKLPLEIKVGQMTMAGFRGTAPPAHIMNRLRDGSLGGIILFGDDAASAQQLRALTAHLQEAALQGAAGLPLLIATDQEGGRVSRLSPPLTRFPCARLLGATGSAELAAEMGRALARELRAVGVNMNLAPVLDIHTNPSNPVIGDRALGADAHLVSALGRALIVSMQSCGVMATAKHFPGHGDTSFDPHRRLDAVGQSPDALWEREVQPFGAAVREGVGAVMTAHVVYHEIDPHFPATLSPKIVASMLRERLGHRGLVITDDLEMKAIAGNYTAGDAAMAAVSAGADIVLVCREKQLQEEAYKALLKAVREGRIGAERIDRSVTRILAAKEKYAKPDYNIGIDTAGCEEHMELVRRIESSGRQG